VTLTFCRDRSAAAWIADSDLPWDRLVCFGPAGFDAYARLRFLPDPVRPGQSENDADSDGRPDPMPALLEVLGAHTATPDACFFCVWEGFGQATAGTGGAVLTRDAVYRDDDQPGTGRWQADARPGWAPRPAASSSTPRPPTVVVPHRAYWMFRGPLADVGTWDAAEDWPGDHRLDGVEPAFVWPADRAWCVARDVDPHWAGIGGTRSLISQLAGDSRLDVVPADPTEEQPRYR
jgi:hypothetical protein